MLFQQPDPCGISRSRPQNYWLKWVIRDIYPISSPQWLFHLKRAAIFSTLDPACDFTLACLGDDVRRFPNEFFEVFPETH